MTILEPEYRWSYKPGIRTQTRYIVLHHAAGTGTAEAVHAYHRDARQWAGIAYHYYVRLDGSVYRGREENWIGGHSSGYNSVSLGVCFEGNFDDMTMPQPQLSAGRELIAMLREKYPLAEIVRHSELNNTACPGINFPFDELTAVGEVEKVYRTLKEVPEYYRNVIRSLMERGALTGRADPDPNILEDNILDLSEDYCRVMATLDKLGVI